MSKRLRSIKPKKAGITVTEEGREFNRFSFNGPEVRCKMQAAKYFIYDKCVIIEITYSNNDLR